MLEIGPSPVRKCGRMARSTAEIDATLQHLLRAGGDATEAAGISEGRIMGRAKSTAQREVTALVVDGRASGSAVDDCGCSPSLPRAPGLAQLPSDELLRLEPLCDRPTHRRWPRRHAAL